jgi:DNA repair exonuclease SbcCD ATPase subunit
MQAQADEVKAEAAEQFENLSQAYGELKHAWENRGPREQDMAEMARLQTMLDEQHAQLATAEQRYVMLRNVCPRSSSSSLHAVMCPP